VRLKDMAPADSPEAALMLRLFKLLMTAATVNPVAEHAVVTRIVQLTDGIFDHVREQRDFTPYLQLLNTIFNALQGCKNDILHRDFQLSSTLSTLVVIMDGPLREGQRELLVELLLTLPTRLSQLLNHLPQLMRPLLIAMQVYTLPPLNQILQ
jgi:transformation/transcription domain-associated protein